MIKGDRINLIPMNDEIFQLTLGWINQPELRDFTNSRFPVNEYEHKNWFEKKANEKYLKIYGIFEKTSNKVIGIVGLNEYDPFNRTAYPYIYIGEQTNQAKGIGTESFNLFIKFLKEEMNVRRVYGFLFEYNKSSLSMLQKCGYKLEGEMREHWYKNGKYHNVVVVGALLED
ncbi:MAG: GNAT family N-acetyltransferase [Firmicutes bacterium]|nr:GNAT family N-acetyltransferase [Bacillota bacterium]